MHGWGGLPIGWPCCRNQYLPAGWVGMPAFADGVLQRDGALQLRLKLVFLASGAELALRYHEYERVGCSTGVRLHRCKCFGPLLRFLRPSGARVFCLDLQELFGLACMYVF